MNNNREMMIKALKDIVVPGVRDAGFTGSFPHFRRMKDGYIDLLTFQFDKYGGGFVVNLGKCTDKGIYCIGEIPPDKVTAMDINDKRARLSPDMKQGHDHLFRYDKKFFFQNAYSKVAKEVIVLLKTQAEIWWSNIDNVSSHSLYRFYLLINLVVILTRRIMSITTNTKIKSHDCLLALLLA